MCLFFVVKKANNSADSMRIVKHSKSSYRYLNSNNTNRASGPIPHGGWMKPVHFGCRVLCRSVLETLEYFATVFGSLRLGESLNIDD